MQIFNTICRTLSIFALFQILISSYASAQALDAARNDQIERQKNYLLDAIVPSGLVRDSLVLSGSNIHPATPDAAGFALIGLSALDHLDKLTTAEQLVEDVLSAYAGQNPAVTPARSADGHFTHYMNGTGSPAGGGWDPSYTTIGTALLVAGAQFAKNHFTDNETIASLTDQLTSSVDFNAAIDPALDGRVFRDMTAAGGGTPGVGNTAWNEYMLVVSLALRQSNNDRALAIRDLWIEPDSLPKRSYFGMETLTDNPGSFAPAFWAQQQHFFNGDFRHNAEFETLLLNHQQADKAYSASSALNEAFRYGLTAGTSPQGYGVDHIGFHVNDVFSPEAVVAWGDMYTFLDFYNSQFPTNDPRYRYGLLRESAVDPNWVPFDTALVDHLFLLFGLVESIDSNFFEDRVIPIFAPSGLPGDFNGDGEVNAADYTVWRDSYGELEDGTVLGGNGNGGIIDDSDYGLWRNQYGQSASTTTTSTSVPESTSLIMITVALGYGVLAFPRIGN